jgi:hypothetical protein
MTLEEFKKFNKEIGNYWFADDTDYFLASKVHSFCESTGYFISSEQGPGRTITRRYTIRRADFQTGRVKTIVEFQAYASITEVTIAMLEAKSKREGD